MRSPLGLLAGLSFLLASACGGSSSGTSGGTTAGMTGGSTSGGTTSGGTSGGLGAGTGCTSNAQCISGVCGVSGTGRCCTAGCATSDATCGASGCDATGACIYPSNAKGCATDVCLGHILTRSACNGAGGCVAEAPAPCANNLQCSDSTHCDTQCSASTDCVSGFYCDVGSHACLAQQAHGSCTTNEACTSGICGIAGSGNCCTAACSPSVDATCDPTDCDSTSGACLLPTACGTPNCTGNTLTAGTCTPTGVCNVGSLICPNDLLCNGAGTACLTTCSDSSSCALGSFCETASQTCCPLGNGGTIRVDGTTGNDATACCGVGANGPCQTLTHAMAMVDAAKARDVTINATVNGGGGDWTAAETYPVVLGWGVELNAPGVFFLDPVGPNGSFNAETFEINNVSANDTVGYASIVGTGATPIGVGMNSGNRQQTGDTAAIAVEAGNTLYLANASVNGSADLASSEEAIVVQGEAALILGQDRSGAQTGTVTVGSDLSGGQPYGSRGIVCYSNYVSNLGCTIQDAPLAGQTSVIIQGQYRGALDTDNFASVTLTSHPVIGVAPAAVGFNQCALKSDPTEVAILVHGQVSFTFKNGTVQCIGAKGILLDANNFGEPTATIDNTVIQNTELGIFAQAGTATVTNTTFRYNLMGVQQDYDLDGHTGTIDLSGGGNTVICSSNVESSTHSPYPGVDVYNTSTAILNASNVAWDTASPDYFDCDLRFTDCSCNLGSCATGAGTNDMDAVEDSTALGGITTTNATQSANACN